MKRILKRLFWDYRRDRLIDRLIRQANQHQDCEDTFLNTVTRIERVLELTKRKI